MDAVKIESRGGVANITLARPAQRNAFDLQMIGELTHVFRELATSTRAVVLRGEGTAFCAGADLGWLRCSVEHSEEQNLGEARALSAMLHAIDEAPCFVVACVQGAALGGGAGVVACCDAVIAAADARFGFTEVRLGLVPAVISPFVLRRVGVTAARRYFLTGELFDAEVAMRIGLVNEVVAEKDVAAVATKLATETLRAGPIAVATAKRLIRTVAACDADAATEYVVSTLAKLRAQPEAQEGMRAFLERRQPRWLQEQALGTTSS